MTPKAKKPQAPTPDHRDLDVKLLDECYCRVRANLRNVIQATVLYCSICLENDQSLYEMNFEDNRQMGGSLSPERMMRDVFGKKIINELPSPYICSKCHENVQRNYMFMCRVKYSCKIINNYIDQINNQIHDVESYVLTSKDNNFSNTVIVLQDLVQSETYSIEKSDFQKKYSCKYCGKWLASRSSIAYHVRNVHSETKKPSKCTECQKRSCIHKKSQLSVTEPKEQSLTNFDCPDDSRESHTLIDDCDRDRLNLKPYLCEACGEAFHSRSSHLMHKHNCVTYECIYCEEKFDTVLDQQTHETICQNVSRVFKCHWCTASFDKKRLITRHIRRKHTQIKCSKCHISFVSLNTLRTHELYAHKTDKQTKLRPRHRVMECILCPKKFVTRKDLREHQSQAHGPNEKYKCKLCHKEFLNRKLYLQHANTGAHISRLNPNAEFSFKCEHCNFSATSSKVLENHVNLIHLKIKPYVCVTCTKAFTTESHLRIHLESHEGIRRYQCPHCPMMLCSMSGLKRHTFRRHSLSRPFPCGECDVQCVTKGELASHYVRKHGGPKSEPCPLCDGKYSLMSHVRGHIRKVHAKGRSLEQFLDEEGRKCPELMEIFRDKRLPVMET